MNYNEIKMLCERRRIPIKEVAAKCGITEAGLHQMIRNKSMKIDVLEKVAEVLEVPVSIFFEGENRPNMQDDAAAAVGPVDLGDALNWGTESTAKAMKHYEGLPDKEVIALMARQIAILKLEAEMANHLAKIRLEKIERLQAILKNGQG
jgi:transcriptional regulator with XRE-family HTH domain